MYYAPSQNSRITIRTKMNQFYLIGLEDIAQQYCDAAALIWEMLTEEEYNQI